MLAILDSEEPPEAARQALNLAVRPVSMEQVVQDVLPWAHDRGPEFESDSDVCIFDPTVILTVSHCPRSLSGAQVLPQERDVKVGSYVVARRPGEPGSGDEDEGEDEGEEASPRGALRPRHHCYIIIRCFFFL